MVIYIHFSKMEEERLLQNIPVNITDEFEIDEDDEEMPSEDLEEGKDTVVYL